MEGALHGALSGTYTPPNHNSVNSLVSVYSNIVENEFAAGRYIGPFLRAQLELVLGPFQTSPLWCGRGMIDLSIGGMLL